MHQPQRSVGVPRYSCQAGQLHTDCVEGSLVTDLFPLKFDAVSTTMNYQQNGDDCRTNGGNESARQ